MRMRDTFLKPMHPEGRRFVAIFAAIAVVLFLIWEPLGWLGVGATVWCYYFFRDPERVVPEQAGCLVSPADGIVSLIERATPPPELGLDTPPLMRVSVFMSVFNCHINRAPAAGRIIRVAYKPGAFFNASLDKASEENERNSILIEMENGQLLPVTQIAGLVARRILCFATDGQAIGRGERFGLIRFGSRLDIYLPEGTDPAVRVGQTMVAGETVIAHMPEAGQ